MKKDGISKGRKIERREVKISTSELSSTRLDEWTRSKS